MAGIWLEEGRTHTMRDGAVVARRAHNPEAVSSNLAPATQKNATQMSGVFDSSK